MYNTPTSPNGNACTSGKRYDTAEIMRDVSGADDCVDFGLGGPPVMRCMRSSEVEPGIARGLRKRIKVCVVYE